MKTKALVILTILVVALLIGFGFALDRWGRGDAVPPGGDNGSPTVPGSNNDNGDDSDPVSTSLIRVDSPRPNALVSSPLVVTGEARGNWYFEADFPVRILDSSGREIAIGIAQAQGEWMTTEFVPFRATINFPLPSTPTGTVVFEKSNPSGLPEHADEVRVPVRFSSAQASERTIKLYYYNENRDKDANGNVLCTSAGLEPVERRIPLTNTPIQDAVRLLIRGELTSQERASGKSTEFPLAGVALSAASLSDGRLTLTFSDPQNRTSGGSCRVNVLRAQIEATAKQFGGVSQVNFAPLGVFEP